MQGGPKPRAGTLNKVILPRTGGRNDLLPKAAFLACWVSSDK